MVPQHSTGACNSSACTCTTVKNEYIYYIDTGVLLENIPLVKFIRNSIWFLIGVFSISSPVKILMTSFAAFSRLFVFVCVHVHVYNKKSLTH